MDNSSVSTETYYNSDKIIDSTADSIPHSQHPALKDKSSSPPSLSHANLEIPQTIHSLFDDGTTKGKILQETTRGKEKKMPMKKKKKFKKLSELVDLKNSYACNEAFNNFQALGAHIATHNRNKKMEKVPFDKLGTKEGGAGDREEKGSSSVGPIVNREKKYKCNLCSRRFLTGQALGGHKNYHRKVARVEARQAPGSDIL
ncbi:zinc finger protein ZAT5-like [Hevea brasiliensis]|uniref:zinc finger protein ZAT5-like n=1 Tax=Hevea brasiliensis TaxID=3981 RepID=UPI0025E308CE|nr:zinc finger protein ZAT5-like [Hevea brasiliensis]